MWFLIATSIVLSNKVSDCSTLSIGYNPLSIRIPQSIYKLSQSIVNSKIDPPIIPNETVDPKLNVLSVRANRLRSSGTATFIIKTQNDRLHTDFWCLFDDASITPVYTFYVERPHHTMFFFECSIPDDIIRRLWYNRTIDQEIKIFLSTSKKILIQGFLDIPWSPWTEENEQSLTLCTVSTHINVNYFIQWIEFHRLVGISKFIIYNISTMNDDVYSTINAYEEEYPASIDIIQWNHSLDEIQYDCFLRYGDISEWITVINLNEYLIPQTPYDTLPKLLKNEFGRNLRASVTLENREFCSDTHFPLAENVIIIEHYLARHMVSNSLVKHFYRSRTINYLLIHQDTLEAKFNDQMKKPIILAQYPTNGDDQTFFNCPLDRSVRDTTIRQRFAKRLSDAIDT